MPEWLLTCSHELPPKPSAFILTPRLQCTSSCPGVSHLKTPTVKTYHIVVNMGVNSYPPPGLLSCTVRGGERSGPGGRYDSRTQRYYTSRIIQRGGGGLPLLGPPLPPHDEPANGSPGTPFLVTHLIWNIGCAGVVSSDMSLPIPSSGGCRPPRSGHLWRYRVGIPYLTSSQSQCILTLGGKYSSGCERPVVAFLPQWT